MPNDHNVTERSFDHTISGLLRARSGLVVTVARYENLATHAKDDLLALDRTLKLVGYKGDLAKFKAIRPKDKIFEHGELTRTIFEIVGRSPNPIPLTDIVDRVIESKNIHVEDKLSRSKVQTLIKQVLKNQASAGRISSEMDAFGNKVWSTEVKLCGSA